MPTIHANGIDLYYERSGDGPRVLYLNGSGATLATSALLIKPFTERFDVAAHDQRGEAAQMQAPARHDGIAPPANSEFIAAHIPKAELHEYDGGHAFFARTRRRCPRSWSS